MSIYAIAIKSGEVFHENFKQQMREALRTVITIEGAHFKPGQATPNLDRLLSATSRIINTELAALVAEIACECAADGSEKLRAELQEKTGMEVK